MAESSDHNKTQNDKTSYVVPKILWDRVYKEWMELSNKTAPSQQTGGAIAGLTAKGVDSNALLQAMAVNQSLSANPQAAFVGHADQMLKQIMANPKLSPAEKVELIKNMKRVYDDQRGIAMGIYDDQDANVAAANAAANAAGGPRVRGTTTPRRVRLNYGPGGIPRTPMNRFSPMTPGSGSYRPGSSRIPRPRFPARNLKHTTPMKVSKSLFPGSSSNYVTPTSSRIPVSRKGKGPAPGTQRFSNISRSGSSSSLASNATAGSSGSWTSGTSGTSRSGKKQSLTPAELKDYNKTVRHYLSQQKKLQRMNNSGTPPSSHDKNTLKVLGNKIRKVNNRTRRIPNRFTP